MATTDCAAGETCFVDANNTGVGNQCIGRSCTVDTDCDACQKCNTGACEQPAPADQCLFAGM
jgi:hypothetical protein